MKMASHLRELRLKVAVAVLGRYAQYRLTGKCYLPSPNGPTVFNPTTWGPAHKAVPTVIKYRGVPNHSMAPVTLAAHVVWWSFNASRPQPKIVPVSYRGMNVAEPRKPRTVSGRVLYDHNSDKERSA
jgi:hypothetical protein